MQPRKLSKEEIAFLVKVARHVGIRPQDLKPGVQGNLTLSVLRNGNQRQVERSTC